MFVNVCSLFNITIMWSVCTNCIGAKYCSIWIHSFTWNSSQTYCSDPIPFGTLWHLTLSVRISTFFLALVMHLSGCIMLCWLIPGDLRKKCLPRRVCKISLFKSKQIDFFGTWGWNVLVNKWKKVSEIFHQMISKSRRQYVLFFNSKKLIVGIYLPIK